MRILIHEQTRAPLSRTTGKSTAARVERRAFLQGCVGNQALQRLCSKLVEGQPSAEAIVEDNGPIGPIMPAPFGGAPVQAPPAVAAKKAGVDSFVVTWKKNSATSATTAKLRLDYTVKFKKDATHDPALAEFRQNAFHLYEVTDGPNKGQKHDNPPLHDDNYSRADDMNGNTKNDVDFVSNDNPGPVAGTLDAKDVIDYSFTAEQMIIDTSDGNKEIAKRGPHTATIKGKHPRTFAGVPKTFS